MYHLKISIPSFRQVVSSTSSKSVENRNAAEASRNQNDLQPLANGASVKGHFVYNIEVGFLGEYGQQSLERSERIARFYNLEKRYSAFLALHNEVSTTKSQYSSTSIPAPQNLCT